MEEIAALEEVAANIRRAAEGGLTASDFTLRAAENELHLSLSSPTGGVAELMIRLRGETIDFHYVGGPPEVYPAGALLSSLGSALANVGLPRVSVKTLWEKRPVGGGIPYRMESMPSPLLVLNEMFRFTPRESFVRPIVGYEDELPRTRQVVGRIGISVSTDGTELKRLEGKPADLPYPAVLHALGLSDNSDLDFLGVALYRETGVAVSRRYAPMFRAPNALIVSSPGGTPYHLSDRYISAGTCALLPPRTDVGVAARLAANPGYEYSGFLEPQDFARELLWETLARGWKTAAGITGRAYLDALLALGGESLEVAAVMFVDRELVALVRRGDGHRLGWVAAASRWSGIDAHTVTAVAIRPRDIVEAATPDVPVALAMELLGIDRYSVAVEAWSDSSGGSRHGEGVYAVLTVDGNRATLDLSARRASSRVGEISTFSPMERVAARCPPLRFVGARGVALIYDDEVGVVLAPSAVNGRFSAVVHPSGRGLFAAEPDDILGFILEWTGSDELTAAAAGVINRLEDDGPSSREGWGGAVAQDI